MAAAARSSDPERRADAAVTGVTHAAPVRRPPRWLYAGVVIGALGIASLAYGALVNPGTILGAGQQVTDATRVYARYAAAYDIALAAALVAPLITRAWQVLTGVLLQAMLAEVLLGIVGIVDHRLEQVPADIALIVIFTLCARRLRAVAST
jgi:hypothetical protein